MSKHEYTMCAADEEKMAAILSPTIIDRSYHALDMSRDAVSSTLSSGGIRTLIAGQ